MLPFGVTIPATVLQRSEIPEGLTNYPVVSFLLAEQTELDSTATYGAVRDTTFQKGGVFQISVILIYIVCFVCSIISALRVGKAPSIYFYVWSRYISNRYCEETTPFVSLVNLIYGYK
jgi:hypothetical protein